MFFLGIRAPVFERINRLTHLVIIHIKQIQIANRNARIRRCSITAKAGDWHDHNIFDQIIVETINQFLKIIGTQASTDFSLISSFTTSAINC